MQFTGLNSRRKRGAVTRPTGVIAHLFWSLLMVGVVMVPSGAVANEHGGGGGEAEGAAAVKPPRDHKEYIEKTTKLAGLASKLSESEKHFAELVHEKQHAPTSDAKQPYLKEMSEVATQRNVDVTTYNKLRSEISLRYPNQGDRIDRHFRTLETHSAEELERNLRAGPSLDDLLTETKRMIVKKYPDANAAPDAGARRPAAIEAAPPARGPRLRLER